MADSGPRNAFMNLNRVLGWSLRCVGILGGMASSVVAAESPGPRLAVVVSIDQGRADYLQRFRPWFGEGGFERLLAEGRVYEESRYRHGVTKTAPGHATILSGVHANVHGIVGNDWIASLENGVQRTNAVEDTGAALVGVGRIDGQVPANLARATAGRSPRNFAASTVGDQLKLRFGERSRVVTVGGKDRSAILLGGKLADGVYWRETGGYVTSTYYRDALPTWVEAFNRDHRADAWFGQEWTRLLDDDAIYDRVQGPDAAVGETEGPNGLSATLPKRIDGGGSKVSEAFYSAFDASPFAVTQLIDFALAAVEAEQLGRHEGPDLLCIGVSQTDSNGHLYGPDSHEVMDGFLRLDREVARLLAGLDEAVGADNYIVVVTADHGVSPLPERWPAKGDDSPTGRLQGRNLDVAVTTALNQTFGRDSLIESDRWAARDGGGYRLVPGTLSKQGLVTREQVASVRRLIAETLIAQPVIAAAWPREELLAGPPLGDDLLSLQRRSYHAERGPDVVFVPQPYVISWGGTGSTHGEPYDYDRHVPMLWMGPGVMAGRSAEPVAVEDIARTLSALLGVEPPPQAEGRRLF